MYHYGRCCLYGIGCDENIDTALSYLEKALNEGNVNAGLLLSTHYASLIKSNNDSNFKKAVSYCAKAYDVAAYDFEKVMLVVLSLVFIINRKNIERHIIMQKKVLNSEMATVC